MKTLCSGNIDHREGQQLHCTTPLSYKAVLRRFTSWSSLIWINGNEGMPLAELLVWREDYPWPVGPTTLLLGVWTNADFTHDIIPAKACVTQHKDLQIGIINVELVNIDTKGLLHRYHGAVLQDVTLPLAVPHPLMHQVHLHIRIWKCIIQWACKHVKQKTETELSVQSHYPTHAWWRRVKQLLLCIC